MPGDETDPRQPGSAVRRSHILVTGVGVAEISNLEKATLPIAVLGKWTVDGDGARTNGAGLVGADFSLTNQGAAYCKVYDIDTTTFANCALASGFGDWTNNYQMTADAASEAINDAIYFIGDVRFCELAFDLSALATYSNDAGLYEYWNGAWTTLPIVWDGTDITANDGLRPWQQNGAVSFIPPADWVSTTVDGQAGFAIRWRVTALEVTQTPTLNGVQHDIVTPKDGYIATQKGVATGARLNNGRVTLGGTQKFILMNYTTGLHTGEVTLVPTRRSIFVTFASPLAFDDGDVLGVLCTEDPGANEWNNVVIEMDCILAP